MNQIILRKVDQADIKYFSKWWRDKDLIALTSGDFEPLSDKKVREYFDNVLNSHSDYHFMIDLNKKTIGHISLVERKNNRYETQIIIGEKNYWSKGYGTQAIKMMLDRARGVGISNIYLEVRPDNYRAIRAYEKCGFIKNKIIKNKKDLNLSELLKMNLEL